MAAASRHAGPLPGDPAPDFTLASDSGDLVNLASLRGSRVILYFYPKDLTPGCTTQACDFRDSWEQIRVAGGVVFGISRDSAEQHQRFRERYSLPFPLLVDQDHQVSAAYGVWGEKSLFGHRFHGIDRTTFGIDAQGVVGLRLKRRFGSGHAAAALRWLSDPGGLT